MLFTNWKKFIVAHQGILHHRSSPMLRGGGGGGSLGLINFEDTKENENKSCFENCVLAIKNKVFNNDPITLIQTRLSCLTVLC